MFCEKEKKKVKNHILFITVCVILSESEESEKRWLAFSDPSLCSG